MKKWKCINEECPGKCKICTEKVPLCCIVEDECAEWEEVTEEHQEQDELVTDCNQLPEWCMVGGWGYDIAEERYFEIVGITQFNVDVAYIGKAWRYNIGRNVFDDNYKQARLRPWTFEEAPLSLKVKDPHGFALAYLSPFGGKYIIAYHLLDEYEKMKLGEVTFTFSAFADIFTQIDGSPCGVLEHMNDDGEWVK